MVAAGLAYILSWTVEFLDSVRLFSFTEEQLVVWTGEKGKFMPFTGTSENRIFY